MLGRVGQEEGEFGYLIFDGNAFWMENGLPYCMDAWRSGRWSMS